MPKLNYRKKRFIIMISGQGSNMKKIIFESFKQNSNVEIVAVFSNNPESNGIKWVENYKINTVIHDHRNFKNREEFDLKMIQDIEKYHPDYILMAGFMRILSSKFVDLYQGKLINIHPSLLPSFKGQDTHQRALQSGVCVHGCTVHFVTEELDSGPIIAQGIVPVFLNDTITSLSERVLNMEHQVYPSVVKWLSNDTVVMKDNKTHFLKENVSRLFQ